MADTDSSVWWKWLDSLFSLIVGVLQNVWFARAGKMNSFGLMTFKINGHFGGGHDVGYESSFTTKC